jgi:hypothetical protein
LGGYSVTARSLANEHNGGTGSLTLGEINSTNDVTVQLRGIGTVQVTVVDSDGATPVPSAQVTLAANAGGFPFGDTFFDVTDSAGVATIQGVPLGEFSVSAEYQLLAGLGNGAVTVPDHDVPVRVQLGDSGFVIGRVLLFDGVTPAYGTLVTLNYVADGGLRTGRLQVTTGLSGRFEFVGIPVGTFSISVFDPFTSGIVRSSGSILTNGEILDVGDLFLDNTAPYVFNASPGNGSTGVAVNTDIVIHFSEQMDPSSFNGNVLLRDGTISVAGVVRFEDANSTLVFTPSALLASDRLYSIIVKGVPNGPRDLVGLEQIDAFVSTFRTRDVIPPTIISISPKDGEDQVLPEAVVRVTFSESISSGLQLTVTNGLGESLAGSVDLSLGNTVAIFTPSDFLKPNDTYTLSINNAVDGSGNPLAGQPVITAFETVDTIAPIISGLNFTGAPIAGTPVTVTLSVIGDDVEHVEFAISGQSSQVVDTPPFTIEVLLPLGEKEVAVTAAAVDRFGNRSVPASLLISVLTNAPPEISMVSGTLNIVQGQAANLEITASDDFGVSQILLSSVGDVNTSSVIVVSGQTTALLVTNLSVNVPSNAPSRGTFTVQAVALDTVGNQSVPAILTFNILDGISPTVAFEAPVNLATVIPGQNLDVVLRLQDDVGVTSVILASTPDVGAGGTALIAPPVTNNTYSYVLEIPTNVVAPDTILLQATARDEAGNTSALATRVLKIADTLSPVMHSIAPLTGTESVGQGQTVTVQAQATDNVGVTEFEFTVSGAYTDTQKVLVVSAESAAGNYSFIVPTNAPTGSTITVEARASDMVGNRSDPLSLVLRLSRAPTIDPVGAMEIVQGLLTNVPVRATDLDGNLRKLEVIDSRLIHAQFYNLGYSLGSLSQVDFTATPSYETWMPTIQLAWPGSPGNYFAARFTGEFEVETAGTYHFTSASDDGSVVYVDTLVVVNNDGLHGYQGVTGAIDLQAGTHQIEVLFFENAGGQALDVIWSGPNFAQQVFNETQSQFWHTLSWLETGTTALNPGSNNAELTASLQLRALGIGEREIRLVATDLDSLTSTQTVVVTVLADTDGDTIPDRDDPVNDGDIDRDGLTFPQEQELATNPQLPDTDGDGLLDGQEGALRLGLLGLWRGEDGLIDSVGDNDGYVASGENPPLAVPGRVGNAFEFDGDDRIRFDSTFALHSAGDASLEFWLRYNPMAHQGLFWTRPDNSDFNRFNIAVNGDSTLYLDYRSPSGALHLGLTRPIPAGQWAHIAIVRSGLAYTLYVNSVVAGSVTDSSPDLPTATGWQISGRGGFMFQGVVDEVSTYNRALSAEEIVDLYEAGITGLRTDPLSADTDGDGLSDAADPNPTFVDNSPPDPALPVTNGLTLWFRSDLGVTESGGLISNWADQAGSGLDVSQASSGAQPTLVADGINGHPVLRFDGGDYLHRGAVVGSSFLSADQATAFFVLNQSSLNFGTIFSHGLFGDGFGVYIQGAIQFLFGETGLIAGLPPEWPNTWHTLEVHVASGVNAEIRIDGTTVASGAPLINYDTDSLRHLFVGVDLFTPFFIGDLSEILVFNRDLTLTERSAVSEYLSARYGIAVAGSSSSSGTSLSSFGIEAKTFQDNTGNSIDIAQISTADASSVIITAMEFKDGKDQKSPEVLTRGFEASDFLIVLRWSAQERGSFVVEGTTGLGTGWQRVSASVREVSSGQYAAQIRRPTDPQYFFRIKRLPAR